MGACTERWMGKWINQVLMPILLTEIKSGQFSKLFKCWFHIILAISKDILYLIIPPI